MARPPQHSPIPDPDYMQFLHNSDEEGNLGVGLGMLLSSPNPTVRRLGREASDFPAFPRPQLIRPWRRDGERQIRQGYPAWDSIADNTVVLGLVVYSDYNTISTVDGLELGIEFLRSFFRYFANTPRTVSEIRARIPILRRRFFMYEQFLQMPGIRYDESNKKIVTEFDYPYNPSNEPYPYKCFRRNPLVEYEAYKTVFKNKDAARLPGERRVTGNLPNGLGYSLDDEFFV